MKYSELQFFLQFYMGEKLGLLHYEKNILGGCLRIGCGGKIFWAERGEIMGDRRKSYMEELCGLYRHQILFG
jgi:hypothetical protein